MKILSISAQKPSETGSGTYLMELVRAFSRRGAEQAVIAGVYREDAKVRETGDGGQIVTLPAVPLPERTRFYPVYFDAERAGEGLVPWPIAGMSDSMPYRSVRYRDMTCEMVSQFDRAFSAVIRKAVRELEPDFVLCHHLYLLTSIVRREVTDRPVYAVCHSTDLRQLISHGLERERIRSAVASLDAVLALNESQKSEILKIFGMPADRVHVIGTGYNREIFYPAAGKSPDQKNTPIRVIFAGKITEKKGVQPLIRSLRYLALTPDQITFTMAGGYNDEAEFQEIVALAEASGYRFRFTGKLPQTELAEEYRKADIFILPSFFEGIPLTAVEAMACGLRAVISDLPGIRGWLTENVRGGSIQYIELPPMKSVDEPEPSGLEAYERRIARALERSAEDRAAPAADLSRISWDGISGLITAL